MPETKVDDLSMPDSFHECIRCTSDYQICCRPGKPADPLGRCMPQSRAAAPDHQHAQFFYVPRSNANLSYHPGVADGMEENA